MTKAQDIQRQYYTNTARQYDKLHVSTGDEHSLALRHISSLVDILDVSSVLDVGCGTGRVVKYFMERHPGIAVQGIEPVQALIDQAVHKNGIPTQLIKCGSGESLPYADSSFDVVCEFAVLHHIKKPETVIREMMRVANKAIFLSDSNRFGQGSMSARLTKLLLYKMHLWNVVNLLKTKGKGYTISEGDGLAYSYSVFDSYELLAGWCDRMVLIPLTNQKAGNWLHPLVTSSHVLLCAIRD